MKGFKVVFRKEEINIAPEFDTGIMISDRNGNYDIVASGIDECSDVHLMTSVWIDSEIDVGESVQVDVVDLDECSQPYSIYKTFSDGEPLTALEMKDMLIEKLENFYVLENLLKREGLLCEDIN